MAEFKNIPDSSSGSEKNVYCILNEDMRRTPSQTSQKGYLWCKQFWIPLMCGLLFMVLLITVTVSFKQQFSKITEVENAVANLTSSIKFNQQDLNKQNFNKLTGLENAVANLTSFTALLSSNQQDSNKQNFNKLTGLENAVANLTSSIALLSSNQQDSNKQNFNKLTGLENAVANLTSSIALLNSNQQDSNDRLIEMFGNLKTELEGIITNLTQRKPVLSCKAGWKLHLSSCYLFSSITLDWQKSRAFCGAQGALLLILGQDVSEWIFIANTVSKSESHWIGLTDEITSQWRWIDGALYIMDKSHWEKGEPNNLPGEDCAEMTKSGKLNDMPCSRSFRFICKAPAIEN